MGQPLQIRTVNDILYSYMLSSSYKTAWIYEQSYALSKDPDIWEVFLRDTSFASSIDRFQNSTVRPYRVEAPKGTKNKQSKQAARIVEEGIRQSMLFDDMRKRLALGRALGRSYEYVNWDTVNISLAGTPAMDWFLPVSFENIDRRRVRWVPEWKDNPDGGQTLITHRELYSVTSYKYQPMSKEFQDALIEDIYPATEDRVGTGRGLLDHSYIYGYYKAIFLEKLSQGIDRWANGMLVGKIDSSRLASLPKTSATVQQAMQNVLQTARSEHVIVLDKVDEIEVVTGGMEGHQMCMDGIKYCDESIERLWNGSIRPSGHASGTGARAQSETESDTSESFYQPYRQHQDEILSRDLVGYFWRHPQNRQNFLKLGLGIAERPHFVSEQIKRKDPLAAIQIISQARQAGIPLLKSEVYEDLEKTMPEPGEDVFDGAMGIDGEMDLDMAGASGSMTPEKKEKKREQDLEMAKASGDDNQKAEFAKFGQQLEELKTQFTKAYESKAPTPTPVHVDVPPAQITFVSPPQPEEKKPEKRGYGSRILHMLGVKHDV